MGNSTPAKEGATFKMGTTKKIPMTVKPKCDLNHGSWYCATCNKGFLNNLMMWFHVDEVPGLHNITWVCSTHGPEVP